MPSAADGVQGRRPGTGCTAMSLPSVGTGRNRGPLSAITVGLVATAGVFMLVTRGLGSVAFPPRAVDQPLVALHLVNAATPGHMAAGLRNAATLARNLGPRDRLIVSDASVGQDDGTGAFLIDVGGDSIASMWARVLAEDDECRILPARETSIWAIALNLALEEETLTTPKIILRAIADLELADEELENALLTVDTSLIRDLTANHSEGGLPSPDRVEPVLVIDASVLAHSPRQLAGGVSGSIGGFVPICYEHEGPIDGLDTIDSLSRLPRADLIAGFLSRVRPARIVIVASDGSLSIEQAAWVAWLERALSPSALRGRSVSIEIVARDDVARIVYRRRRGGV